MGFASAASTNFVSGLPFVSTDALSNSFDDGNDAHTASSADAGSDAKLPMMRLLLQAQHYAGLVADVDTT
jgi:hypothetical protein